MKHEWNLILAVCYQLKQLKKQPEKNSGLNPESRSNSGCFFNCDSTLRGSNFTHVSSAVRIYDFHIFIFIYFTIIGYIMNSQLTIYPCGLVAQWIEHCTGIARSWVRIPFKPEFFFFRLLFQLLKLIAHCGDQISLMFHPQFAYMIFIYSYSEALFVQHNIHR